MPTRKRLEEEKKNGLLKASKSLKCIHFIYYKEVFTVCFNAMLSNKKGENRRKLSR
jgi:hypothetical protein